MNNLKLVYLLLALCSLALSSCSDDFEDFANIPVKKEIEHLKYNNWNVNQKIVQEAFKGVKSKKELLNNYFLLDRFENNQRLLKTYLDSLEEQYLLTKEMSDEELVKQGFISEEANQYLKETLEGLEFFTNEDEQDVTYYIDWKFNLEDISKRFSANETSLLVLMGYNLKLFTEDFFEGHEVVEQDCEIFENLTCQFRIQKTLNIYGINAVALTKILI